MIEREYRIRMNPALWDRAIEVLIYGVDRDTEGAAKCFDMVADSDGNFRATPKPLGSFVEPTFRISPETAQELFDRLWAAGYRPNGGRTSEGVVEAQRDHIKDLRSVIEKVLPASRGNV